MSGAIHLICCDCVGATGALRSVCGCSVFLFGPSSDNRPFFCSNPGNWSGGKKIFCGQIGRKVRSREGPGADLQICMLIEGAVAQMHNHEFTEIWAGSLQ